MLFREIIGQEEIKRQLRHMIQADKLPHALMLAGAEGVGKLPLAMATAQYLCCTNRTDQDSCGECPSCVKFAKLEHPDLHLVFPIAADKSKGIQLCDDVVKPFRKAFLQEPYLTIDDWINSISDGKSGVIYKQESEDIIRKLNLKSYESEYKVILLWLPEKMNEECANKLLKILEEPYANTHFFLVSNNPEAIIGTIRSRAQTVSVPPIAMADMRQEVEKRGYSEASNVELALRLARGSWSAFHAITSQKMEQHHYFELFVQLMRSAYSLDVKGIKLLSESLSAQNREQQKLFLQKAQQLVRENFISRCQVAELNYMQTEETDFAKRFSKFIHEKNIEQIMDELQLAEAQIEQNVNSKFVFFHLCLQLYFSLRKPL